MAGAFDHDLTTLVPRRFREFAKGLEFGKLRSVVCVRNRAGTQSVAKRERDVVFAHEIANLVEALVEEAFAMTGKAPARHDRAAARHDACGAVGGQRHMRVANARMDGEIIDALLCLFNQRVLEHLPIKLQGIAADFLQRLIDRHGADRHGRIAHDPVADVVNVATC